MEKGFFFCSLEDLCGKMCAVTIIRCKIGRAYCLQYLLTPVDSFFRTHHTHSNGHSLFFCNQVGIAWQNEGWAQKMEPEQCKKFKAAACTETAAQEKVKTKEQC